MTPGHRRAVTGMLGLVLALGMLSPLRASAVEGRQGSAADLYGQQRDALLAILADRGASAALEELGRRSISIPGLAGVCHAIAHDLGHAALQAAGGRIAQVLGERDDVCGGGFTHGAVERALGASKHPERDLLTVCAPAQDGSCFHGVGHGLMFATGMDVGRSLRLCDAAPSSRLSARCGEGVFMQWFSAEMSAAHAGHGAQDEGVGMPGTSTPTLEQATAGCRTTRMPYAASCWFYAPTLWLAQRGEDFLGALRWCESTGAGARMCTKGVGSRTVKFHPENPRIGARVCARARDVDACLQGMGSYWSVHWRGERPPRDVCGRLGEHELEQRCRRVT